ncbi:MAG: xanthine phosphoribosyltransferase [Clostridia bacterium]|nr:xanthine phosphoribosyltransferase [Clostridia bacterium]
MKLLEERIAKDGRILPGDVLKLDSFLNYQIDVDLLMECAAEWYTMFKNEGITKILTIESSGIALACVAAQYFKVPVLYAKKSNFNNVSADCLSSKIISYTRGRTYDIMVPKRFISTDDRVLIIDDFLSNGSTMKGMINVAEKAGATVVGAAVAVEKTYLKGGEDLRNQGYRIEALARIKSLDPAGGVEFAK